MLKTILLLFVSLSVFAGETANYNVHKGKFHKGGWVKVFAQEQEQEQVELAQIVIKYSIKKKLLAPVPAKYLKGEHTRILPASFLTERGYEDLALKGQMKVGKATIFHMGQRDYKGYRDCHVIKIISQSGRTETTAYYHPNVPAAGWVFVRLKKKNIPIIGNYTIMATLQE